MQNHDRAFPEELAERTDQAIAEGMKRGRRELERRQKRLRRRTGASLAIALLLVACLFTIRVSPVFAAIVRDIPGLKAVVDLVKGWGDQGLELAVDNDFVQPVGVSDEHDGIRLTVQGVIADDQRLVIFYEVKAAEGKRLARVTYPEVRRPDGQNPEGVISYDDPTAREEAPKGTLNGTIDVQFIDGASMPDEVNLLMRAKAVPIGEDGDERPLLRGEASEDDPSTGPLFKVNIPIDREKFAGLAKVYTLNETITAEGQNVTFVNATVSPLRVFVQLRYDEANRKQITGPGDIRLVDEKGTEWKYKGGFGQDRIYFESPYFRQPKELYLEGSWFRALDKNRAFLVIDTDRGELIRAPDDNLKLANISRVGGRIKIVLTLNITEPGDNMGYGLLVHDSFTDASGKKYPKVDYSGVVASFTTAEPGKQTITFAIDEKDYKQPLTFNIYDYPNYIRQPYKIRIR